MLDINEDVGIIYRRYGNIYDIFFKNNLKQGVPHEHLESAAVELRPQSTTSSASSTAAVAHQPPHHPLFVGDKVRIKREYRDDYMLDEYNVDVGKIYKKNRNMYDINFKRIVVQDVPHEHLELYKEPPQSMSSTAAVALQTQSTTSAHQASYPSTSTASSTAAVAQRQSTDQLLPPPLHPFNIGNIVRIQPVYFHLYGHSKLSKIGKIIEISQENIVTLHLQTPNTRYERTEAIRIQANHLEFYPHPEQFLEPQQAATAAPLRTAVPTPLQVGNYVKLKSGVPYDKYNRFDRHIGNGVGRIIQISGQTAIVKFDTFGPTNFYGDVEFLLEDLQRSSGPFFGFGTRKKSQRKAHTPQRKAHTSQRKAHTQQKKAHTSQRKAHTSQRKAHTPKRKAHTSKRKAHTSKRKGHN